MVNGRKKVVIEDVNTEGKPDKFKEVTEVDVRLFEIIARSWTDDEILLVATRAKIVVPGFSNRALRAVPKTVIRKHTIDQMMKMRKFKYLLSDLYSETYKSIQLNTEIDSYYRVEGLDSITYSCKLSMMLLQYGEFFNANSDKIFNNVEQGVSLLQDLVERPEHTVNSDLMFTTEINRMKPQWLKNQVGLYDSKLGPFTEEDFKFHPNGYETPGYAFTLLLDRAELVEHLEPGVARAFLQSGLIEVMELAIALKQDATNLTKANADLAAANESLSAKVDKLTKEKLVADEAVKRLKGDNKEYGKIIKEAKTTMSDALAEVDRLDKALEFERAKAVEKLILDERVRVVGTQARPQLASYMPAEQIQVSRTVTSLKTAMERIRKQQAGLLWFVDLDGLTTKESFDVEQWMQKHKLAYRMVSGSTVELVQRILVDMQGDMQYETN